MNTDEILSKAHKYYVCQEGRPCSFKNAQWKVERGLEILEEHYPGFDPILREVFVYAMAWHNAGLKPSTEKNGETALDLFCENNKDIKHYILFNSGILIRALTTPYTPIEKLRWDFADSVLNEDFWELVKISRDLEQLLIIGIDSEALRFGALVELVEEYFKMNTTKIAIINISKEFFNNILFYSRYGEQWSCNHLEKRKQWYLESLPIAIDLVYN